MVQRVLLPKTSSDGKGTSTDEGVGSSTDEDDHSASRLRKTTNGNLSSQRRLVDSSTYEPENAWAPPSHGISVRSFIRNAAGSKSLKARLEALRHRAHTGRWDDAILHLVRTWRLLYWTLYWTGLLWQCPFDWVLLPLTDVDRFFAVSIRSS